MKYLITLAIFVSQLAFGQSLPLPNQLMDSTIVHGPPITVLNAWKAVGSGTSHAVTVSPASGHLLIVAIGTAAGSQVNHAVSDNIGGTSGWVKVAGVNATVSGMTASLWYKPSIPSGITTVTCNGGTSTFALTGIVHEVGNANSFTVGESASFNTSKSGGVWLTPSTVNGTLNSIFFAVCANDTSSNPSPLTINATGTVGTWNHFSANSVELNGAANVVTSVPNMIVSNVTTEKHAWAISDSTSDMPLIIAAFH